MLINKTLIKEWSNKLRILDHNISQKIGAMDSKTDRGPFNGYLRTIYSYTDNSRIYVHIFQ